MWMRHETGNRNSEEVGAMKAAQRVLQRRVRVGARVRVRVGGTMRTANECYGMWLRARVRV